MSMGFSSRTSSIGGASGTGTTGLQIWEAARDNTVQSTAKITTQTDARHRRLPRPWQRWMKRPGSDLHRMEALFHDSSLGDAAPAASLSCEHSTVPGLSRMMDKNDFQHN